MTYTYPSQVISPELVAGLRLYSAEAERAGVLHTKQLQTIFNENWLRMFVPVSFQGLELSLPDAVKLQEGLAWVDGNIGWTVTLCSGANWFIGFLNERTRAEFFTDAKVCLAGSGAASGKAVITPGGYIADGRWKYATGAPYATAFTANCTIYNGEAVLREEDGAPVIRTFIFKKDEVTIHDDWNTTGLKATASHSFSIKNLKLANDRCFMINSSYPVLQQPIFRFPFLQFAEATIAANYSGMLYNFIDQCYVVFNERIKTRNYSAQQAAQMLEVLGRIKTKIDNARDFFYTSLYEAWEKGEKEKKWRDNLLLLISKSSHNLAKISRVAINELYPYCGMMAADPDSVINKIWRDFHTATQHELFTFENKPALISA